MKLWIPSAFLIIFSILSFSVNSHANDPKTKVQIVFASLESINMRVLKPNERSWKASNGEFFITNACGKYEAQFKILFSHNGRTKDLKTKDSIGEWCRPPFQIGQEYLLFLDGNKIVEQFDVLTDDDDYEVVPFTEEDLRDMEGYYELSRRPIIKSFSSPVYDDDYRKLDAKTREWIAEEPNLKIIRDEEGEELAAYKTGFHLLELFPEYKTYDD